MSTYLPKPGEIAREWQVVDASGQILGRLASKIAILLQGKHKPTYTPHVDTGDFVVVVNARQVKVTGRKADQIQYDTYSRYPSGRRLYPYRSMIEKHPDRVLLLAVRRMLPKNRLGRAMLTKLKVYAGAEHPHAAQQPKQLVVA